MLRCSKEAFARCPTHHLCGRREEATFMEGSECDKFNEQVCSQPMTNADRIRAMSDEELVALLLNNPVCKEMDPYRDRCAVRKCRECLLEWLQQPAKEEANHA